MRAVVQKVNYKRGFVAYETEDYDYGWLEILDTVDLEIEDELEGPFTDLGETIICKKSTGESIHVFIEDYGMSKKKAFEMVMR